jgi:hypothetical protein
MNTKRSNTSFIFICDLFSDVVSSSDHVASNGRVINELERIWKKAVVT